MSNDKKFKHNLVDAYDQTVEASDLVEDVDSALVASGRTMAKRIQDAVDEGEGQEVTKALYLTPHLMNILREMGATPKSRADMKGDDKKAGDSDGKSGLGKFRSITGGKTA